MSRRFQFSLKWLFVATLAVACFFGGIRFERERRRREDEALLGNRILPYLEQQVSSDTKWMKTKDGKLVRNPLYVEPKPWYLPNWLPLVKLAAPASQAPRSTLPKKWERESLTALCANRVESTL
jgi:hypothetical protein